MNPIIPRVYLNLQRTAIARRILEPLLKMRVMKRGGLLLCALGSFWHQNPANAMSNPTVIQSGGGSVICTAGTSSDLVFGPIDPLSTTDVSSNAQINWTCTNSGAQTAYVTFCLNIGDGDGGMNGTTRQMDNGGNKMNFQLFQPPPSNAIWGSELGGANTTPFQIPFTIPAKSGNTNGIYNGNATLYGTVAGGQNTLVPGNYVSHFTGANSAISAQYSVLIFGTPTYSQSCGGTNSGFYFPFNVTATVVKNCTVTAGQTLNLGSVSAATQTNISASNAIDVTCTKTTPFTVGLAPSNGSSTGAGVMSGSASGNTDQLPYQLYSNSALSTPWGNTATATNVGNGVAGTGTGTSQQLTVWAKVNSADVTPDAYEDTVTINVNY